MLISGSTQLRENNNKITQADVWNCRRFAGENTDQALNSLVTVPPQSNITSAKEPGALNWVKVLEQKKAVQYLTI